MPTGCQLPRVSTARGWKWSPVGAPLLVLSHLPIVGTLHSALLPLGPLRQPGALTTVTSREVSLVLRQQGGHHCQAGGQLVPSLAQVQPSKLSETAYPQHNFAWLSAPCQCHRRLHGQWLVTQDVPHLPSPCYWTLSNLRSVILISVCSSAQLRLVSATESILTYLQGKHHPHLCYSQPEVCFVNVSLVSARQRKP